MNLDNYSYNDNEHWKKIFNYDSFSIIEEIS